uniref:Secreted protein n=1 Tax=Meloidogyne incognita TaxID=6306 RepID=A0A914MHI4_MELIC
MVDWWLAKVEWWLALVEWWLAMVAWCFMLLVVEYGSARFYSRLCACSTMVAPLHALLRLLHCSPAQHMWLCKRECASVDAEFLQVF